MSDVNYTNTPVGSNYGTDATVTTFAAHGLNPGDNIKFTSGRWEVTMPNVAGINFTENIFGGVRLSNVVLPFYSPTNPTQQASTGELNHVAAETFSGIRQVKSSASEGNEKDRFFQKC